ncbi:MAG: zinc ribbon domain-containing protein [Candidatus Odinarchaeota archaeon]
MSMKVCPQCGYYAKPDERYCHHCGTELIFADETRQGVVDTYRGYVQIIGIVEIVLGFFDLVIGVIIALITALVTVLITNGEIDMGDMGDVPPVDANLIAGFIGVLLGFIALLFVIIAIVSIVSGIKLLQYKKSGRMGTMLIGAISLLNVPIGTAFGIGALYILTKPEVEQMFS